MAKTLSNGLIFERKLTLEYNREDVIKEIDEILGVEYPTDVPPDAVTSKEYGDSRGLSRSWASNVLKKAYEEGKLERCKKDGRLWYWPKTV